MPDFMGLMKQAAELKTKVEAMQAELDRIEVEGTAGGGLVTVKLSAKSELKGVHIDPSLLKAIIPFPKARPWLSISAEWTAGNSPPPSDRDRGSMRG